MERPADGLEEIPAGRNVPHGHGFLAGIEQRENAVIRSDEMILPGRDQDRAARAADSGVNDHQVDRAGGEIMVGLGNGECAVHDVIGPEVVANVDELRVGIDV